MVLSTLIVTDLVTDPYVAVMVSVPAASGATYSPASLIVPEVADHSTLAGRTMFELSFATASNLRDPPRPMFVPVAGVTVRLVIAGTAALDVGIRSIAS